jgi:sulfur carrier protein ThiS
LVINVRLHTILHSQAPEGSLGRLVMELPEGSRLSDLLAALALPLPVEALLLAINGRMAAEDDMLEDGDRVNIMPALEGG